MGALGWASSGRCRFNGVTNGLRASGQYFDDTFISHASPRFSQAGETVSELLPKGRIDGRISDKRRGVVPAGQRTPAHAQERVAGQPSRQRRTVSRSWSGGK